MIANIGTINGNKGGLESSISKEIIDKEPEDIISKGLKLIIPFLDIFKGNRYSLPILYDIIKEATEKFPEYFENEKLNVYEFSGDIIKIRNEIEKFCGKLIKIKNEIKEIKIVDGKLTEIVDKILIPLEGANIPRYNEELDVKKLEELQESFYSMLNKEYICWVKKAV